MEDFTRSAKTLRLHKQIIKWGQELQNKLSEAGLVLEQIQATFTTIINKEVRFSSNLFYYNSKEDASNHKRALPSALQRQNWNRD